jgi:hypothetical protein
MRLSVLVLKPGRRDLNRQYPTRKKKRERRHSSIGPSEVRQDAHTGLTIVHAQPQVAAVRSFSLATIWLGTTPVHDSEDPNGEGPECAKWRIQLGRAGKNVEALGGQWRSAIGVRHWKSGACLICSAVSTLACRSVRNGPGAMQLTVMLIAPWSRATPRDRPSRADLVAE